MILLDITTSYQFRHWNPMGILRVEHEVYEGLSKAFGGDLTPAIYDQATNSYYRIPEEIFEELIFRNGMKPTRPERALTAKAKWRSWIRILRFLRNARKLTRSVPGVGDVTHRARQDIISSELLRISLEEFGWMATALRRLAPISQRVRDRLNQFEHINHHAHYGTLRTVHDDICVESNRINEASVKHYVSVGGFWSDDRYRLAYRNRHAYGWTNHYLIYDLIPILWGHVAEPTTRETFPVALHWMLWGVDQIWTISETTKRDLLTHVSENGYPDMPLNWVKSLRLGSEVPVIDFPIEEKRAVFDKYDLKPGRFVMMVGTLEPRKNHDFAYRLWREMQARSKKEVLPLVWVGQPGWAIEPFLEMIKKDQGLPHNSIRVLSHVSDSELVALYRACRFTIYPSHYEGWGLPVVESLTHGTPCIVSTAPSLAEAGGDAVEIIDTLDGNTWLERCLELMHSENAYLAARDRAASFSRDSWDLFREDISADFERFLMSHKTLTNGDAIEGEKG